MTFAHPAAFLALIPAAAALAWSLRRGERRRASLLYPVPIPPRRPWGAGVARWGPSSLRALAYILLAAGLARPQKLSKRGQTLGQGIDIMLALDTSTSMNALDFKPGNRLEAAKDTAVRFVQGRAQDRIGLVAFGGAALLACPLTLDYEALVLRLREMEAGMTGAQGTAIGDGIVSGINHLRRSDGKSKVLILLTDGRSNTGLIDPVTAAKAARTYGVKIYTIGTAKKGETLLPVDDPTHGRVMVRLQDDLDEETLNEVARVTDGRYWRAEGLRQLHDIYGEIDGLEKSDVKLPDIVSRADIYQFPVLAAALILLLEMALSRTLWLRWP